uniref:Uncharacterized protein n=1 Tax=Compsopogon caeruleus TaxID=31354 RepID=A0A7S1TC41_9RHOD|mmetsp:Transcript_13714/g.28142  ORF Transcript_13714/g.28142 Transcript_13714/m.28142 type:complete len:311 (+) Transcript_13714:101-1033(+)
MTDGVAFCSSGWCSIKTRSTSHVAHFVTRYHPFASRATLATPVRMLASALDEFQVHSGLDRLSGDFLGYEVVFSPTGCPREVPDRFVPDQFRDWGVRVYGFEVLTSTKVEETDGSVALYMKRVRALPAVGCEADAVSTESVLYHLKAKDDLLVRPDLGAFACPPLFGITHPTEQKRVILMTQAQGDLQIVVEQLDAPFSDGEVLPACGSGPIASFAEKPTVSPDDLLGQWSFRSIPLDPAAEQEYGTHTREASDFDRHCLLPLGLSVLHTSNSVELGWLLNESSRVVLVANKDRKYGASVRIETRQVPPS